MRHHCNRRALFWACSGALFLSCPLLLLYSTATTAFWTELRPATYFAISLFQIVFSAIGGGCLAQALRETEYLDHLDRLLRTHWRRVMHRSPRHRVVE
jgi:hypothetical protein